MADPFGPLVFTPTKTQLLNMTAEADPEVLNEGQIYYSPSADQQIKSEIYDHFLQSGINNRRSIEDEHNATKYISYVDNTPIAKEKNNKTGMYSEATIKKIANSAKERGVDPNVAIALSLVETGIGNSNKGLYSRNPLHMNDIAAIAPKAVEIDPFIPGAFETVYPDDVTDISISHLAGLIKRAKGNTELALKMYNGMGDSKMNKDLPYNKKVLMYMQDIKKNPDIQRLVGNR